MDKKYYGFVGIYTFTYAAIGMLLPLLGQYLAFRGFSGVQIGVVTATATTVGICASPFWGYRSHHSKDSTRIVILLCAAASLIILGLISVQSYLVFLIGYAVFSFFQTPIMPLSDAMTLQNKIPFGAVRKWGAIGFAAGVFAAGQIAEATSLSIIFPLCTIGYTIALIIIIRLRVSGKIEQPALCHEEGSHHGDYRVLLKNKRLMALLCTAFFICGTNIAHNTYFGFLYKDVGGSIAGIGLALLLMCGSEAPFMAWTGKLEKILTMERMILISMVISALRYIWYSTGPGPGLIIGTFFLQGMVNGIVLVGFVQYISKLVEPAMIGMAMTLYQAVSSNTSSILCQLISGTILDFYGATQVYAFFACFNFIGIILYIAFGLYKCRE
jgi:PPP family 3-phenylpropionic acid transporter